MSFEKYNGTITENEFRRLIDKVYNPSQAVYAYLNVSKDSVEFFEDAAKTQCGFSLKFAPSPSEVRTAELTYKPISQLKQLSSTADQPLKGIRIAVDPGHIGGNWADMEERQTTWGKNPTIREGDMNLIVANLIKTRLEAAGAQVYMTRHSATPTTSKRPSDFIEESRRAVYAEKNVQDDADAKSKGLYESLINRRAELEFYRNAEISQRAENLRRDFLPDLTICNHFNATEKSGMGEMVKDNRHALFINGSYGPDEINNSKTRWYLFAKLLEQSLDVEMAVSETIAAKFNKLAPLPPVNLGNGIYQCRVNENPYLFARNLAATRQYPGPSVILEPFYMNNPWTAERLAAGDYDGIRKIAGGKYRSIFRDYADAVAGAIIETYSKWTAPGNVAVGH
jgi:N-acetylmuramoyl-L-alanine amidase